MYLNINAQLIDEFSSFSAFLTRRVKADFAQNALPLIHKLQNASSYDELVAILKLHYEGISYQKIKFSLDDLSNVLMWVDAELALPELYESMVYHSQTRQERMQKHIKAVQEAKAQRRQERAELKQAEGAQIEDD